MKNRPEKWNIFISTKGIRRKKRQINHNALRLKTVRILQLLGRTEPIIQNCKECELSLLITTDDEIALLNNEFRGIPSSTDVLSFPLIEENQHRLNEDFLPLGDIVISLETAQRQAEEFGLKPQQEITLLLTHGILHLLGYDHEGSGTRKKLMREKEKEVLSSFGIKQELTGR